MRTSVDIFARAAEKLQQWRPGAVRGSLGLGMMCSPHSASAVQRQRHAVAIEALGEVSPLSWQPVNSYGRYRFEVEGQRPDPAAMASEMDIEAAILERRSVWDEALLHLIGGLGELDQSGMPRFFRPGG